MLQIIDVTLRDGGHAVKFDWPKKFAKDYYETLSKIDSVKYVELGYWGQTAKSTNDFYNLNMDVINGVTQGASNGDVSIMIDYHYCNKDLDSYPTSSQGEVGMIRMCSRKTDIKEALIFGERLKDKTGLGVSFNIFNSTNYSKDELLEVSKSVANHSFDFVYFADTHGCLDLRVDFDTFKPAMDILKSSGKKVGMHLHDHSGKGYLNYSMLENLGFESSDTSVKGMGKGSGNLKLEHVIEKGSLADVADFIRRNEEVLKMKPIAHELISAKYGISDNYARYANENDMDILDFDKFCSKISGNARDEFSKDFFDIK